ncbi:hypothetical protein GGR95_000868 [Sulfitobacter undariae]|uniref:M23ase beta-sheet core domain-containing protein n=1 Tax=Sulfitobacter undariae TaxID=1563671 RepID=A0A7W6E733_9RHOB|nr:M23 family metallopeptidase [Sulfitobacter undariae]MBB3993240.1 hypothetical protein [Sulfitobacter undariae]
MRLKVLILFSLAVPATAGELSLTSPIDCDLNGPCYIQQYVDQDASDKVSDFTCSGLSYDGHKGTDFALASSDMIAQGVDVLASAAGVVSGVRDGIEDVRFTSKNSQATEGRECGNGVIIRHDGGWETQYCHMRQNSVSVERGQQIQAGDVLGQVGMSGRAAFPHVHLSVRRDGNVVDPFDPDGTITCGEVDQNTLWSDLPPYRAGGIISIGTGAEVPEFSSVRDNSVPLPNAQSEALVFYAFLFGTQKGDVVQLSLSGPDGGVLVERDTLMKRRQAQSFRAIGKKLRAERWPAGAYEGNAALIRSGKIVEQQALTLTLP